MAQFALPPHSNGVTLSLEELLYYKSQSIRWLPPARSLWSVLGGMNSSRQRGRGMDFEEVRQYQAGDDIRSIDWRVTARTGKPHTKLFSEDKQQSVLIYLDLGPDMLFGSQYLYKSVQAAHLAAVLIWTTLSKKDRIGALIDTGSELLEFKPTSLVKGGLTILNAILNAHNRVVADSPTHLDRAAVIPRLQRMSAKGSEIIFISDFVRFAPSVLEQIATLKQHHSVRLVQLYDPLEYGETDYRGQLKLTNGQTSRWFNFGCKQQKMDLKNNFEQHQQQLRLLSYRHGIPFSTLSCAKPLINQIAEQ
ncbi:cytosolic protein [Vibrio navarrensis]|jgi:uncharacterized protein (DUF58 family)|nr:MULTISPECIES: DUF58 domain-containing protein [Vibrio]EGR2795061.1 DUF58 domain-containing protein [Vibrio navarrensis]EHA1124041.1 DUF58 domain-containing protein [Vibrio navarrensis]EJL6393139.1 DUF58 domain-containing protein [Vibrio navarrensis]EJN6826738.1 DUF58 domain-containing protein [Vibrio cidicii]EKA5636847.1 DUF58 domain-containing protein [Vibrio navarrensis]